MRDKKIHDMQKRERIKRQERQSIKESRVKLCIEGKVRFFAYLRELFEGKEKYVEIETGATIHKLLDLLCDSPELCKEVFKGRELNPNLLIFKNGSLIQSLHGLETKLNEGDTINIFPFIGGG